jgi:hypothetical protein
MFADRRTEHLLAKHAGNGLFVDTNLLLLYIVGKYDRRRIESFKRTLSYTLRDFQRLGWLIGRFERLWTTPNVMTEVDNLGRQLPEREWPGFLGAFADHAVLLREEVVPTVRATKRKGFDRLGLCDSVTVSTGQEFLLLSDDLGLYLEALKAGIDAINFNHLRML